MDVSVAAPGGVQVALGNCDAEESGSLAIIAVSFNLGEGVPPVDFAAILVCAIIN